MAVLENKRKFREDYKNARGYYPEDLAAENFLRRELADHPMAQ
jgi:hypothetical protein